MQPINPWLSRFAKLLVAATFCLIFLGGMVTSVNAGLSVPDWPTSYGYNMFTFPIDAMGGADFFRAHAPAAGVVRGIDDDGAGGVDLAEPLGGAGGAGGDAPRRRRR